MKKALVLLTAICMVLAMAACTTTTTQPVATTAPTAAPETSTAAESTPAPAEIKTLSIFIDHTWYPTKTFTGIIPDEITKQTGVKLDPTIAVDDKQLGVMIASGELPDLVYTWAMKDRMSNADLSYCYDDLISQYSVPWEISALQRGNALSLSTDGKVYCVTNHFATTDDWKNASFGVPMTASLFYRKDLYEQLGSPQLDSLDDLTAIFAQVKEKWADVVPFTFDYNWRFQVLQVWNGLGNWLSFTKMNDGTYKFYAETEQYKNMLKLLNGWFQKGYMTADNFAATNTTALVPYESGKAFALSSCTQNNNLSEQVALTKVNPAFISVESKPLASYKYTTTDIGWSGTFITKKCKDPETAIKFMAWEFTPVAQVLTQNGREGTEYTLDANGIPKFSDEWMTAAADGTQVQKYDPWFYLGGSEIAESFGRCASLKDYDKLYAPQYKAIKDLYENWPWVAAAQPKVGTDEKDILDSLGANSSTGMIANFEAKIIMSATDADFDKNYAEFLAAMKSAGVEQLDVFMNTSIPEMEKSYK
jgi:putative aldouronate transport system substrate-binding protein